MHAKNNNFPISQNKHLKNKIYEPNQHSIESRDFSETAEEKHLLTDNGSLDKASVKFIYRIILYFIFFLAFCLSSIYIALVSDGLAAPFALYLAEMRQHIIFSAFTEVLIAEFFFELVREILRKNVKNFVIILFCTIIFVQAAFEAGITSSILILFVGISLIASITLTKFINITTFRLSKLFMIILTGIFGFYGFSLALTFILATLISKNIFCDEYLKNFEYAISSFFKKLFLNKY